jgi:FMN phosphatase YigB (HAD superfamily)
LFWGQWADPDHVRHSYDAKLAQWLFKENRFITNDWMRGKFSSEDISTRLGKALGVDPHIILNDLEESCRKMTFNDSRFLKIISNIRNKGIRVVIATDNMDTFRRYTLPGLKLDRYFDDFLISCEVGSLKEDFRKGNSDFFANYLKCHNIEFKDTVLIDDAADPEEYQCSLGLPVIKISTAASVVFALEKYVR